MQSFNSFDLDNRRDEDLKAELHLRTDELGEALTEVLTKRTTEGTNEIARIRSDFFLESHLDSLTTFYLAILQAELERFLGEIMIVRDFFAKYGMTGHSLSNGALLVVDPFVHLTFLLSLFCLFVFLFQSEIGLLMF